MPRTRTYDSTKFMNALVEEIGEAEDELQVLNDSDVETPDPPSKEEPAEPVVPVEEKPADPEVKEEARASWSDDYNDLKSQVDFLKGSIARQQQPVVQPQSQAPQPKRLREIEDNDEYVDRMEAMERTAASAYNAVKTLELKNAQRTMAELKAEFPDIDQVIGMEHVVRGVELRIAGNSLGEDWKEPLLRVYDVATGGKRHQATSSRVKELEAELQRLKDEVAVKRTEKQERDLRAAGMVPSGGSVFQETSTPQAPRVTGSLKGRKSYQAAAKAMTERLAQHGG